MKDIEKQTWFQCWIISLAALLIYHWLDARELADLGRYHQMIPDWIMWFQGLPSPPLIDLLFQIGGWLNGILSVGLFFGLDISIVFGLYAIICSGIFWFSLRKVPSVVLWILIIQPIWQVGWRMNWIHVLETSLLLLMWSRIDDQTRFRNIVLSILLVWLRPSAIIWIVLLMMYHWIQNKRWQKNLTQMLLGMLIGVGCIFPNWWMYIEGKLFLSRVEIDWIGMLSRHGYTLPVIGMLGLAVPTLKNGGFESRLWIGWVVVSIILVQLFGVGVDNFPLFFVGLALMAGTTLSQKMIRTKWLPFVSVFILFLPFLPKFSQLGYLLHRDAVEETSFNFIRPMNTLKSSLSKDSLISVLPTVCQDRKKHCLVVSAGGIAHPHRESLGRLVVVSPELSHVRVERAGIWFHKELQLSQVELALVQNCQQDMDGDHPMEFIHRRDRFIKSVEDWSIIEVVQMEQCKWTFFTPKLKVQGTVPNVH